MKTLLLMRHAKSSWENEQLTDHERPLNDRGRRDAPVMGARLASSALPDRIICSTAKRALETARLVAEAMSFDGPFDVREGIYHATPAEIIAEIAFAGGDASRLLAVGHNPGMSELASALTDTDQSFPTAAIALIELEISEWTELPNAKGRLIDVWTPKDDL